MKFSSILLFPLISMALCQSALSYEPADLKKLLNTTICPRCNLNGADLSHAKLNKARLSGAFLAGVSLKRATLHRANLTRTDLVKADLTKADLSMARLVEANLSGANLSDANMQSVNLRGANLTGSNLDGADLTGAYLYEATMPKVDLRRTNLTRVNLSMANLTSSNLNGVNLSGRNLAAADLSGADLSHANMRDVNLSGANLNGADLGGVELAGAYLYGTKMIKADLRGANLEGARLSGINLTDADLRNVNFGIGKFEEAGPFSVINEISVKELGVYGEITDFDLNGDRHYFTSKPGKLYELKNGRSRVLFDFSENSKLLYEDEAGLLSVASRNDSIFVSYTIQEDDSDDSMFLVVDQYTEEMKKIRRVVKINTASSSHVAGTLGFDSFGMLYLSVGDGRKPENQSQDMQSLLGKILRIDVSETNPEPEIVAYGLRNPWKFSIDANDRMFIGDVGGKTVESVYLLEDLYPVTPYNLGWPMFEGTTRVRNSTLLLDDTLLPIFEYRNEVPLGIAVIGGHYLGDDIYLLGDFLGNLRLLRKQKDNKWREIHFQKTSNMIWSLGYDPNTQKSYMSGAEKIFQLEIPNKKINRFSSVIFCRTTMPDGSVNSTGC